MSNNTNILDIIIRQIAKEQDLKIPQVEHIIDSQFRFINNVIESGEDKTIGIIHLGKFTPNGIKQAKQRGEYKRGRFLNKHTTNSKGFLELLDLAKIKHNDSGKETNENMC